MQVQFSLCIEGFLLCSDMIVKGKKPAFGRDANALIDSEAVAECSGLCVPKDLMCREMIV